MEYVYILLHTNNQQNVFQGGNKLSLNFVSQKQLHL